jgi:uroporphyrinogen decarboxylase
MALAFCSSFAARNVGYPIAASYNDVEKAFWAQLWTAEMYGSEDIPKPCFGGSFDVTWAFGGEIKWPTGQYEQAPMVVRYPIESEDDARNIQLPPDIRSAGPVPLCMEFSKMGEKHGLPIWVSSHSPFEDVRGICGIDKLCRWLYKEPELVHRLLRLATDFAKEKVRYWVETFGPERLIAEAALPSASNQVISPKHFEKFVLPYQKELHEMILSTGIKHIVCHICGEQNRNLPYWTQIPMGDLGIVDFGHEVDLTTAIKYFGDTCVIGGNVEPAIIQTGTAQQVYDHAKQCIEKGKNAPRGYILMPSCGLPPMSPPYNVFMLRKAINDHGWYV